MISLTKQIYHCWLVGRFGAEHSSEYFLHTTASICIYLIICNYLFVSSDTERALTKDNTIAKMFAMGKCLVYNSVLLCRYGHPHAVDQRYYRGSPKAPSRPPPGRTPRCVFIILMAQKCESRPTTASMCLLTLRHPHVAMQSVSAVIFLLLTCGVCEPHCAVELMLYWKFE